MNPWIFYGVMILVFIMIAVGFYLIFSSVMWKEEARKRMSKAYAELTEKNTKRVEALEDERRKYGNILGRKGFVEKGLDRLDKWLMYSGWSIKVGWLNTSTYLVLNVVIGAFIFLVTFLITYNVLIALILMAVAVLSPILCMMNICDSKYKAVEQQLVFTIDTISNAAAGTDDLVKVLKDSAPYLAEPLKGTVERAVATVSVSGNATDCAIRLAKEIEHPQFVRFIRHLEISSRGNADYGTIARDFAPQVEQFVAAAGRRRAVYEKGRRALLALFMMSLLMVYVACSLIGDDVVKVLFDMTKDTFGIIVLVVEGLLCLSTLLYALFGMRR